MPEKIKMTSSKNNRVLVDEYNLEKYFEMGYIEGWPEEVDAEKVKETAEQLDKEEANGDSITSEPKPESEPIARTESESTEVIEE